MDIFVYDISEVSDEYLKQAMRFLSDTEKKRLDNMISVKRRREFIVGHFLLRQVLSKITGKPLIENDIEVLKSGALMPVDQSVGYVSLSHSFEKVAIAVAPVPVGIDVEKIRSKDNYNAILEQIDSVKQAQELMREGCSLKEAFFRLWTRREALYKMLSVCQNDVSKTPSVYYRTQDEFMFCVASTEKQGVQWHFIENC